MGKARFIPIIVTIIVVIGFLVVGTAHFLFLVLSGSMCMEFSLASA